MIKEETYSKIFDIDGLAFIPAYSTISPTFYQSTLAIRKEEVYNTSSSNSLDVPSDGSLKHIRIAVNMATLISIFINQ